jgi:hypothetical protein
MERNNSNSSERLNIDPEEASLLGFSPLHSQTDSSNSDSPGELITGKVTTFSHREYILAVTKITKSYFGVGFLAIPYGFHVCGFQLALALITANALMSFFTTYLLIATT